MPTTKFRQPKHFFVISWLTFSHFCNMRTTGLDVARTVALSMQRLRPRRLRFGPSPAPVSSIFTHCMTVTSDMRSPSVRKTPPKALSKDNCASCQQSLGFFHLYLFSPCLSGAHSVACKKSEEPVRKFLAQIHAIMTIRLQQVSQWTVTSPGLVFYLPKCP